MGEFKLDLKSDNIIVKFINYCINASGGYLEIKYVLALTLISIISDRKVSISNNYGRLYTNVWTLILGASTISKKSTSINEMTRFLTSIGIYKPFARQFSKNAIPQILAADPHAMIINDEIGELLADMHKSNGHMQGVADLLCCLYDNPDVLPKVLCKEKYEAHNIFISLAVATTLSRFRENCNINDFESGFLARLLIVTPKGDFARVKMSHETKSNIAEFTEISNRLLVLHKAVESCESISLYPSEVGYQVHQSWYDEHTYNTDDEHQLTIVGRLSPYFFKLSALYYMASPEFIDDLKKAKETQGTNVEMEIPDYYSFAAMDIVHGYFFSSATELANDLAFKNMESDTTKVLRALEKAPNQDIGLEMTKLEQTVKIQKKEFNEIISSLITAGKIEIDEVMRIVNNRQYVRRTVRLSKVADPFVNYKPSYGNHKLFVDGKGNYIDSPNKITDELRRQDAELTALKHQQRAAKQAAITQKSSVVPTKSA